MPTGIFAFLIAAAEIVGTLFFLCCLATVVNLYVEGRWPFEQGEE